MPRHPGASFLQLAAGPGTAFAGCRAALGASVCSHLLWLLKIRTGTMSSATSNTHLVESSINLCRQALPMWHSWKYCIAKVVIPCRPNPDAQYSDSEQYISSAMGPELMINFCPRDYIGIYVVKSSKSEHFNDRIFIKIHQQSSLFVHDSLDVIAAAS